MVSETPTNHKPKGKNGIFLLYLIERFLSKRILRGKRKEEDICTTEKGKGLLSAVLTT